MSKQIVHILAFESSCDDTSVAVLRGSSGGEVPEVLSVAVQSQDEVHQKFGGVVPELASRAHLKNLIPCTRKVLHESGLGFSDIDLFAATHRPGLVGCLLIGHSGAKALSFLFDRPLVSCHHIHSHLQSIFLENSPTFPFLTAVVSGGHTSLYVVRSFDDFEEVGVTLDDALGEAFDKGAKLLGLGFPGGPELDRLAQSGDSGRYRFGRVKVAGLDFSFSGLKSELQRLFQREGETLDRADVAASYQSALLDHLLQRVELALTQFGLREVAIVGGVARNSELRKRLASLMESGSLRAWYAPSPQFCTDNAAMVGVSAFRKWKRKEFSSLFEDVGSTRRPARGSRG